MLDRECLAALGLCLLGFTVGGVAAARPAPPVVTVTHVGEPLVTVLAVRSLSMIARVRHGAAPYGYPEPGLATGWKRMATRHREPRLGGVFSNPDRQPTRRCRPA